MEALPPDATVIGYWDTIPAIQYYQLVEHLRPDIEACQSFSNQVRSVFKSCSY